MLNGKMIDELIRTVERAEEHALQQARAGESEVLELRHCPTPMYEMPRIEVVHGVA
jgi:hypothetical protein